MRGVKRRKIVHLPDLYRGWTVRTVCGVTLKSKKTHKAEPVNCEKCLTSYVLRGMLS
jgi:hypothetical protein